MKGNALSEALGALPEDMVAEAMEPARARRSFSWLRLATCIAIVVGLLLGFWYIRPVENDDQKISLDGFKVNGIVHAFYDKGYTSVDDLLEDTTLIVRATPIAIESESDMAICWVLRVEASNPEGLEVIRLRQLKDAYVLEMGEEVVLALQPDAGEGYYHIPGGGCGLFRTDEATETVSGLLLGSLKELAPDTYSSDALVELTLHEVFDILITLSSQ